MRILFIFSSPVERYRVAVWTGSSQRAVSNLAFEPKVTSQKTSCGVRAKRPNTTITEDSISLNLRLVCLLYAIVYLKLINVRNVATKPIGVI